VTGYKSDAEDEAKRGTRDDGDPLRAIEVTNCPDCEPESEHERDRAEDDSDPPRFCAHGKILPLPLSRNA
jgi:hypothetical protein